MTSNDSDRTVSESREESLLKALELLGERMEAKPPLHRPDIPTGKTLLRFLLWILLGLAVTGALYLCGSLLSLPSRVLRAVSFLVWLVLLLVKAKSMVRCAVLLYQKHAPEKVRRACVFTPTCSEYMLLAIDKYGLPKGLFKGIGRLCRCHYPNGGEDYP